MLYADNTNRKCKGLLFHQGPRHMSVNDDLCIAAAKLKVVILPASLLPPGPVKSGRILS